MVIIYTGEGKGKTTAAIGLALRAAGYGKKILIVQFVKSNFSGELESLKRFDGQIILVQKGAGFVGILGDKKDFKNHQAKAKKALEYLKKELDSGKWDVVIADELIGAVTGDLVDENLVLSLISGKLDKIDFVLTGRGASKALIEKADLVTEMKKIKHPFDLGIFAKEGIDY